MPHKKQLIMRDETKRNERGKKEKKKNVFNENK